MASGSKGAASRETARMRNSLASFDMVRLRELRNLIRADMERVSYWLRLLESRLSAVQAGKAIDEIPARILSVTAMQTISFAQMISYPAPMPEADGVWSSALAAGGGKDATAVARAIDSDIQLLNNYRAFLKQRVELVTEELIDRYRGDPSLVESLLPKMPNVAENERKPSLRSGESS